MSKFLILLRDDHPFDESKENEGSWWLIVEGDTVEEGLIAHDANIELEPDQEIQVVDLDKSDIKTLRADYELALTPIE